METILAMDAGGSKTDAVICDNMGRLLGCGRGGQANVNFTSQDTVETSLADAVNEALTQANLAPSAITATCVAGPVSVEVVSAVSIRLGVDVPIHKAHEGEVALWATQPWCNHFIAVAVDAGTGSIVFGRDRDGRTVNVGGWGALIGDEGSGYWIGLRALNAVTRALDERDPPGLLSNGILAKLGVRDHLEYIHRVYRPPLSRSEIASFAPLVVAWAWAGDPVAIDILSAAGVELGEQANTAIRRLSLQLEEFAVLAFGSVFKSGDLIGASFRDVIRSVAPHVRFVSIKFPPVVGAAVIGLQSLDVAPVGEVLDALAEGAANMVR